jgi:hypothetical protein
MRESLRSIWLLLFFVAVSLAGCSRESGGGGQPLLVTVTGVSAGNLSKVTAVMGDHNGAMLASGAPDRDGNITFFGAPVDATITAALSCLRSGATTTDYNLAVQYDVNESVVLYLPNNCDFYVFPVGPPGPSATALGVVTINVTNTLNGVTQNDILNLSKPPFTVGTLITRQTITVETYDLQTDGKISIIVAGKDEFGRLIGYGALLDQTFTDGMSVDITVDQPISFIHYQFTNLPATANYLCSGILQSRTDKGSAYYLTTCNGLSSPPSSATIDVPYIPALGDRFNYSVSLYLYPGMGALYGSGQYLAFSAPAGSAPSDQSFDFGQALTAPRDLAMSGVATATPTLSWSGVDPTATDFSVSSSLRLSSGASLFFTPGQLSLTRTSITFPELPDSLAAFRPVGVDLFGVFTSASDGVMYKSSNAWWYSGI